MPLFMWWYIVCISKVWSSLKGDDYQKILNKQRRLLWVSFCFVLCDYGWGLVIAAILTFGFYWTQKWISSILYKLPCTARFNIINIRYKLIQYSKSEYHTCIQTSFCNAWIHVLYSVLLYCICLQYSKTEYSYMYPAELLWCLDTCMLFWFAILYKFVMKTFTSDH